MESGQQLSDNYSFRSSGNVLRIYHGDAMEQVSFDVGGSFTWSDGGKGYSLELKEVRSMESDIEMPEGARPPMETSGIFEFSINDGGATPVISTIEIRR